MFILHSLFYFIFFLLKTNKLNTSLSRIVVKTVFFNIFGYSSHWVPSSNIHVLKYVYLEKSYFSIALVVLHGLKCIASYIR